MLLPRRAGSVEDERSLSGRFLEIASTSPCFREGAEGDLLCCLTRDCFWVATLPDLQRTIRFKTRYPSLSWLEIQLQEAQLSILCLKLYLLREASDEEEPSGEEDRSRRPF